MAIGFLNPGAANTVLVTNGAATAAIYALLVNANIDPAAAIALSKLAPGGPSTVVQTDPTGTFIGAGLLGNPNISPAAAIAGTKIDPDFGAQTIETDGPITQNAVPLTGLSGFYACDFVTGNSVSVAGTTYVAMTGNSISEVLAGTGLVLTAAGCVVTYTGPTRRFLVTLCVSLGLNTVDASTDRAYCAIARNGDVIGSAEASATSLAAGEIVARSGVTSGAVVRYPATSQRLVTLASGDTVQPVFGSTGLASFSLPAMTFLVQPTF